MTPRTAPATPRRAGIVAATVVVAACGWARCMAAAPDQTAGGSDRPSQQERMAERGFVRYRGAWRTVQEIELIERAERESLARREWVGRLQRLRRGLADPGGAAGAAEEIREIADPAAVPALLGALAEEPDRRVRGWYVEALSRIDSPAATRALAATALDHPDAETRIAAAERLLAIGPHLAEPLLVAALRSADNARVNRAAEALGRLGTTTAIGPLIDALETSHTTILGDGTPAGSTTATFTPAGGGLSVGGGAKPARVTVRNEPVLEALVRLSGVTFAWDVAAWRNWLSRRHLPPPSFDPRRG